MVKSAGMIYWPKEDATPEAELDALARVYRFILDRHADRHAKKMAAELTSEPDGHDNAAIVTQKERSSGVDRGKETKKRSYQGATKGR